MNHPVLLVPHQEIYLQSWKNFPEIRWHMLVTGFGGGKTRANVILTLMLVRELQGLKDRAGDGARIIVAGYTLLHLERTFLLYFKSYLDSSKTEYRYDSKTHIFYIGTVTILLIPMETPENIFGEDCCIEGSQRVHTLRGMVPIKDVVVGDYVLTRKGYRKVLNKWNKGYKECMMVNGLICTPDHKIYEPLKGWVPAEKLTAGEDYFVTPEMGVHQIDAVCFFMGEHEVYDIEVEDAHEFFAEGVLVHNCACIQEESDELPEATLMEACKALSERTRQQIIGFRSPFICLGTTSQGESGLYRLYCQFKKKGTGFVLIRGRTQDNFYLPKEQIIDLYKMYDDTERRVFLEGEFLAVSRNRVFPGFDWARNYSDDDFDKYLKPGERVFIGMDFNASYNRATAWVAREGVMHCIAGDIKITTLRGDVPMRDVLPGDYVLTRRGYKRVLTKMDQGDKIVYDFGRIRCTPDHVAITPEGDTQVCKAKQFYCLKEQSTEELKKVRDGEAKLLLLKKCFGSVRYGEDTRKPNAPLTDIISNTLITDTQLSSMWKSMQDLLERYLSDGMSTTRTDQMTTDLRALSVSAQENMHDSTIQKKRNECCQNVCWKDEEVISSLEKLTAACAERLSQLIPLELSIALSAGNSVRKNGHTDGMSTIENVLLTELVMCAEKLSEELQSRSVALSIGTELTPAASNQGFERVYDIEVEDCHEFFANGILVHNCVKSYDFPDASDSPDIFRYDFPDQDIYWIPDVTTKDSYPQYARALRKNNIHIIHRSKNPLVEDTAFLVSVLCKNGRIMFHKMAREAADSIARAVRDKDGKIGKGKAPSDWQHYADGVRYACSYMALVLPDFRDIRQSLITHIASLRREVEKDEAPSVRKLSAGYTQIDPAAFFKK